MLKCKYCEFADGNAANVFKHQNSCTNKPQRSVVQKAVAAPTPLPKPPIDHKTIGDSTLKDIANGGRSDTFYMAANQSLITKLEHIPGSSLSWIPGVGSALEYYWPNPPQLHTTHFRNMVATILLETATNTPGQDRIATHQSLLNTKIADFNKMSKQAQLKLLDELWESCYEECIPETLASEMDDGEKSVDSNKKLPSSLRQVDKKNPLVELKAGPEPDAWKKWNVGFRIDGGKNATRNDLDRILREGCTTMTRNPDLAVSVVKKFYHEHKLSRTTNFYFGYQNRDIYNESATCLARSLLGATAFPYRWTHNTVGLPTPGGDLDFQYLFVVDCKGARGVDTEKKQLERNSLWRPGEKAFAGLEPHRILGWTKIIRLGQGKPVGLSQVTIVGWRFKFVDSKWNWVKPPGADLQKYLEEELSEWQPGVEYTIPAKYDFA